MKYKIGVFASCAGDLSEVLPQAIDVGRVLGDYADAAIVITGAGNGIPYEIAKEAARHGVEVWGFSDSFDLQHHKQNYPDHDLKIYSKLIYISHEAVKDTPFDESERARKKYRNVFSTSICDGGIVLSGRWGALNEFTNLVDMQKITGVLTGTGGIADELPALSQKITKEGQGQIIFDDDPIDFLQRHGRFDTANPGCPRRR